jgi:hypothetical protein
MPVQVGRFPVGERVAVRPFVEQRDGENATIGDPARGVFLSIPVEGVEILQMLQAGETVGESASSFERAYGEAPDMDDFLGALAAHGLVARWDDAPAAARATPAAPAVPPVGLGWVDACSVLGRWWGTVWWLGSGCYWSRATRR